MTPDELRALADATAFTYSWEPSTEAEVQLVRLAPDIARLCAELGEALTKVRWLTVYGPGVKMAHPSEQHAIDAALAKLSSLEPQ